MSQISSLKRENCDDCHRLFQQRRGFLCKRGSAIMRIAEFG